MSLQRAGQNALFTARPSLWEAETKTWRFKFPLTTVFLLAQDRGAGFASDLARFEVEQMTKLCRRGMKLDGEYLQRRCVEYLLARS